MNNSVFNLLFVLILQFYVPDIFCQNLPEGFEDQRILQNLLDPASMEFSPDGRLFYGERISGKLRIAKLNPTTNTWELKPNPFYSFDVPPERHRSSGLRGFAFDPDFENNGYVYVFYMKNNPRHNRVVRIEADPNNPDVALENETLLMSIPFNTGQSSGSHNGGDILFGQDGQLYFTTGDGWNGGDNVQSLTSYTGKLFRINKDGSIPTDNPFYNQTTGNYRGIYCIGLRNPYTMAIHPESGHIYVNDAVGSNKASVFQIKSNGIGAGTNFGHDGYDGIGVESDVWNNVFVENAILVTGGAWYPKTGNWPQEFHNSYFTSMWGSNSSNAGSITRTQSETDLTTTTFASNVISPPRHKPVMLKIGPDSNLYYMLTDYETGDGEIHKIEYTGRSTVAAPTFNPPSGQYDGSITVEIFSNTSSSIIYYTLDGSDPTDNAIIYTSPIEINTTSSIRAIAYAEGLDPSHISSSSYIISTNENIPPVADAGPDIFAEVNTFVTLNGSDSYDPDGDELEISESWEQISGPTITINDADETVANFRPVEIGEYIFRITVTDIDGAINTDEVTVTVLNEIIDITDSIVARWSMEEGMGDQVEDTSDNSNTGTRNGAVWSIDTPDNSNYSLQFDGVDDIVDVGSFDVGSDAMSIVFWTKVEEFTTADARFISKASGDQEAEHFWMVSTFDNTKVRFRLKTVENGTLTLITSENVLTQGEWVHVAAIYDGSAMKIYINGVLIEETPMIGVIATDPSVNVAIGNQPANASGSVRPFQGSIDEMRVYNRALTPDEINTINEANSLSITENQSPNQHQQFILYPNPIERNLQIEFGTDQKDTPVMQLYNNLGKLVSKKPLTLVKGSSTIDFDFRTLRSGVYYLKIGYMHTSSVYSIMVE